ncbi:MAG: dTDP-4-dehydrorhamnose reductase, partial [Actinomycetota bacterium]
MSRVLVTGAGGQVGRALVVRLGERAVPRTRAELDITDAPAVRAAMEGVEAVVNAAAYTDVDGAEADREAAFAINAAGAATVAQAARRAGAFCVHLSTDFVFDGALGRAYREDDAPNPISVYSASKLEGERLVRAAGGHSAVVRTAWVYAAGHRNFLSTILERARAGATLDVVTDQVGSPTWAADLAAALAVLLDRPVPGLFHV